MYVSGHTNDITNVGYSTTPISVCISVCVKSEVLCSYIQCYSAAYTHTHIHIYTSGSSLIIFQSSAIYSVRVRYWLCVCVCVCVCVCGPECVC